MSIETLRPTANTNPLTGGFNSFSNPANAYDGNAGTAATATETESGSGAGGGSQMADLALKTWAAPSHQAAYTALVIKAMFATTLAVSTSGSGTAAATYTLSYSTDGGSTWTTLVSGSSSQASTTVSASLSTSITFSNLQFKIEMAASASGGPGSTWSASSAGSLFEVWTEGTYPTTASNCAVLIGF